MSPELHEGEEPAPPGVRPAAALRWLLLLGAAALAVWAFYTASQQGKSHLKYTCPMVEHAFVVADEPGDCPLCHMKLMPLDPALIEARRVQAQEEAAAAGPGVPGLTPVSVHLDRAQKMGVRSVTVDEAEIDEGARAPAYVASPEQGESRAHARAPGYVERIVVTEVGTAVAAGQPLAYVYAPEIYKAQEEFLLARRWRDAEGAAAGAAGSPSSGLAEAARRRLSLLGLSDRDVAEIIEKNAPIRATAVRAPAAGVVTRKEVALGSYVTPETPLFEIVDLSRAYLVADLLASEASLLRPGTEGRATFAGQAPVPVRVDLVYPEVNASTRTTRVRLRFTGAHPPLRPGLYGEVFFAFGRRRALLVPRDALVDTGTQRYVFVDQGDGKYSPRLVVTGAEQQGRIEIRSGLASGERVVSGATFLIDAESRLQAAFSGLLAAPSASAPALPAASFAPSPHDHRAHAAPPPAARAAPASATPAAPASTAPAALPSAAPAPAVSESRYVCPMHPGVVSPAPGRCPICNMDLEKAR